MTRTELAEVVLKVLENHSGKCLDNGPERAAVCNDLVDVLALRLHLRTPVKHRDEDSPARMRALRAASRKEPED